MSTLKEERAALRKARTLLEILAGRTGDQLTPASVRTRAREILRHLPGEDRVVDVLGAIQTYENARKPLAPPRPHEVGITAESWQHMLMSDTLMKDAIGSHQSVRGSFDAAFDSGYFALLSVLTRDEREASDHPNEYVVEAASRRLGLDPVQGHRLKSLRYSADESASLSEVVTWAEGVRARVLGRDGE